MAKRGWDGGRRTGECQGETEGERDMSPDGRGEQGRGGTFSSKKVDYDNYHDDGADGSQHDHHLAVFPPVLPL